MNFLSWNCRGLENPRAVRVLGDLVKSRNPDLIFLIETLCDDDKVSRLMVKLGFDNHWIVSRSGRSGGLVMAWNQKVRCRITDSDSNHIDVHILDNNKEPVWRLTGFYGFPQRTRRKDSWEFIRQLAAKSDLPWCLIGDYNDMVSERDKKGIHKHP